MTGPARGGSDSGSLGWNLTRRSPPARRGRPAAADAADRPTTNEKEESAYGVRSCVVCAGVEDAEDARGGLAASRKTERVVCQQMKKDKDDQRCSRWHDGSFETVLEAFRSFDVASG